MSNFINISFTNSISNTSSLIFDQPTNTNSLAYHIKSKLDLFFNGITLKSIFSEYTHFYMHYFIDYLFNKPQTCLSHVYEEQNLTISTTIDIFEKIINPTEISFNYNSGIGNFTLHFKSSDNTYYYKVSGTYEFEHNGTSFTNKNLVINSVFESATSSGVNLDTSTGILTFSNTGNIKIVFSNHCAV